MSTTSIFKDPGYAFLFQMAAESLKNRGNVMTAPESHGSTVAYVLHLIAQRFGAVHTRGFELFRGKDAPTDFAVAASKSGRRSSYPFRYPYLSKVAMVCAWQRSSHP